MKECPLLGEPVVIRLHAPSVRVCKGCQRKCSPNVFTHDIDFIVIVGERGKLAGFNVTAGGGIGIIHGNKKIYPPHRERSRLRDNRTRYSGRGESHVCTCATRQRPQAE
jgi:hypothetical protein